ncbi:MAG: tRNA 2-selenouridine(34) synthase MnmH [Cellvibrionales bacterium TMED148]|nr:tRNA 2-selenouridine(34) synthase MnmH [Porticoccaceae bacterium]RPG91079.1 MAG: tRNA 2-selenouridine(34) synthase MnmH [Cellvibrionales bacterium TMED148]
MNKSFVLETKDYRNLLLKETTIIDVRAPIEFAAGAIPGAINLPLLSDIERQQIGTHYRQGGRKAAIKLGADLVQGSLREKRVKAWAELLREKPRAVICCARGGLRSQISQQWLAEKKISCPRVAGGNKAIRNYLLRFLMDFCAIGSFTILSGMTGTGKTALIKQLKNAVDLEGAANHKGSSFGRPIDEQPSQIDFENRIAVDMLAISSRNKFRSIILEDESRMIGACQIPPYLKDKMQNNPVAVIEMPFEDRIERLWTEYIVERYRKTSELYHDECDARFSNYLKDSLLRIKKRLGGTRAKKIFDLMQSAILRQQHDGFASHRTWLAELTRDYYDPMYAYQLKAKKQSVVYRGNFYEVRDWLNQNTKDCDDQRSEISQELMPS